MNSKMGVHTRLTDEVEPWKIRRTLQMVREMGAPWIVEYFPWAYCEPSPGRFDWRHADLVVDHARSQGLTVIARLGFVPQWARPSDTNLSYLDESKYGAFADFVAAFVAHFEGRVNHVIIWNEPNVSLEWGFRPPNPAGYARLLAAVYPRAKEANPQVQVLAGALAPTLALPGDPEAMGDLEYLRGMYEAGAGDHFDGLAVHAYGWSFPPEDPPAPDKINFRRVELLREIMVEYGDEAKNIYITEGGWNDHPRWTKAVHPLQRARYTVRAYEWARERWPWCRALCPWAFRYPRPAHTYQDYFTFVTTDFQPKLIYEVVQDYSQGRIGE
ncbi:MAG: beta-galactosidase [Chloroflexota bacterium]|nr:beta-galactosidase [Chloroflexota bacterium]